MLVHVKCWGDLCSTRGHYPHSLQVWMKGKKWLFVVISLCYLCHLRKIKLFFSQTFSYQEGTVQELISKSVNVEKGKVSSSEKFTYAKIPPFSVRLNK